MKFFSVSKIIRFVPCILLLGCLIISITACAPSAAVASGDKNYTIMQNSEEQLVFSDKANAQFALMEQAHIPDQYKYYAGCYI